MASSRITKNYLSPQQIEQAIEEASSIARDEELQIALVGGAAMQLYGSDRFTKGVDFITSEIPQSVKSEHKLSFGGIAALTKSKVPVDFIVRNDKYQDLYEAALLHAVKEEGIPLPVVTPEYLAVMKLAARRIKDEQDLGSLIYNAQLDLDKTRGIIREHLGDFAVDTFDSVVYEIEWRKSRGE